MFMLKVSYPKMYGKDSCVFDQRIRLSKELKNAINNGIREFLSDGIDSYDEIYLKIIVKDIEFLNLTQLKYVRNILNIYGYPTNRILNRNTVIEFI